MAQLQSKVLSTIDSKEGLKMANEIGAQYIETSARLNINSGKLKTEVCRSSMAYALRPKETRKSCILL
jgi:hypothetical protein